MTDRRWVPTREVADRLGIKPNSVRTRMTRRGKVPVAPGAGYWWEDDVAEVEAEGTHQGQGGGGGHKGIRRGWCGDTAGEFGGPHRMDETRDKYGRCSVCVRGRARKYQQKRKQQKGT